MMWRMMKKDKDFTLKYIKGAIILAIVSTLIIVIFFGLRVDLLLGLYLGTLISVLFFRLMYINALKAVEKDARSSKRFTINNYFIRLILYGIILFVAYKNPNLNFYTTAIGFTMIKFSILFIEVLKIGK